MSFQRYFSSEKYDVVWKPLSRQLFSGEQILVAHKVWLNTVDLFVC